MDIKQYAPIIIPTLNRFDHFKQCIESLEKCTDADKTEVFVGLDFPPSEKYKEGWEKIDNYLKLKEERNGFAKLTVIRRETNCGVGSKESNSSLLHSLMRKQYSCYIISEDDNVFSPNFLDYMNQCLDAYKDDERVYAVSGYCHPHPFEYGENTILFHQTDCSCWGYGLWSKKVQRFEEDVLNGFFEKNFSLKKVLKMRKFGYNRLYQYLSYVFRNKKKYFRLIDCVISCYVILKDDYIVIPTISKTRNIGWDSMGHSFASDPKILKKFGNIAEKHKNQLIDNQLHFTLKGDPAINIDCNNEIAVRYSDAKISGFRFIIRLARFCIKRLLGKI